MSNVIVPTGVSGQPAQYNSDNVNLENLSNELTLLNLGSVVPLNIKIDCNQFMSEIKQFDSDWVDYLPRTDRPNNRQALTLTNLPETDHKTNVSLAQASYAAKSQACIRSLFPLLRSRKKKMLIYLNQ